MDSVSNNMPASCGRLCRVECLSTCGWAKTRHQQALKDGMFEVERMAGKENPADAGTKALDSEGLRKCSRQLGLLRRTEAGFGQDAAAKALIAMLIHSACLGADGCPDQCELPGQCDQGEDSFTVGGACSLLALVFVVGLFIGFCIGRWSMKKVIAELGVQATVATSTSGAQATVSTSSTSSQGPCTYTRWCKTPRYKPLPEKAWG